MNSPQIKHAVEATLRLSGCVSEDLDTEKGGIGWITDQIGWKHSSLIGDYLLSSIQGVYDALESSAICVEEYQNREMSQNMKLSGLEGKDNFESDDYLAAASAVINSRNEKLLSIFRDHSLIALAQALDRVAAVVLTIAGVRVELLKVDWSSARREAFKALNGHHGVSGLRPGKLADADSEGRRHQDALLTLVLEWDKFGPDEWLPWLSQYRNTAVHRAPFLNWILPLKGPYQVPGGRYIRPFALQPGWAESESMYRSARHGIDDLLLMQSPSTVLNGLTESTAAYCASLLEASEALWCKRRDNPQLIVQPAGMWPNLTSSERFHFPGYGETGRSYGDMVALNPERGRRLEAFRLTGDLVTQWRK